jgi:hypothetical protein
MSAKVSASSLAQVPCQRLLRLSIQTLLHDLDNAAIVASIRVLEVLSNPLLDIGDFWERVAGCLLAGVELCEANAEAELVDVGIGDDVVCGGGNRGINQELDQALCGERPALGVAVDERLRVAECLGERHDGGLAIGGACELLGVWQDDGQVHRLEDAILESA